MEEQYQYYVQIETPKQKSLVQFQFFNDNITQDQIVEEIESSLQSNIIPNINGQICKNSVDAYSIEYPKDKENQIEENLIITKDDTSPEKPIKFMIKKLELYFQVVKKVQQNGDYQEIIFDPQDHLLVIESDSKLKGNSLIRKELMQKYPESQLIYFSKIESLYKECSWDSYCTDIYSTYQFPIIIIEKTFGNLLIEKNQDFIQLYRAQQLLDIFKRIFAHDEKLTNNNSKKIILDIFSHLFRQGSLREFERKIKMNQIFPKKKLQEIKNLFREQGINLDKHYNDLSELYHNIAYDSDNEACSSNLVLGFLNQICSILSKINNNEMCTEIKSQCHLTFKDQSKPLYQQQNTVYEQQQVQEVEKDIQQNKLQIIKNSKRIKKKITVKKDSYKSILDHTRSGALSKYLKKINNIQCQSVKDIFQWYQLSLSERISDHQIMINNNNTILVTEVKKFSNNDFNEGQEQENYEYFDIKLSFIQHLIQLIMILLIEEKQSVLGLLTNGQTYKYFELAWDNFKQQLKLKKIAEYGGMYKLKYQQFKNFKKDKITLIKEAFEQNSHITISLLQDQINLQQGQEQQQQQ